jgi:hypothetical protein
MFSTLEDADVRKQGMDVSLVRRRVYHPTSRSSTSKFGGIPGNQSFIP